jgi:hypothetical protein
VDGLVDFLAQHQLLSVAKLLKCATSPDASCGLPQFPAQYRNFRRNIIAYASYVEEKGSIPRCYTGSSPALTECISFDFLEAINRASSQASPYGTGKQICTSVPQCVVLFYVAHRTMNSSELRYYFLTCLRLCTGLLTPAQFTSNLSSAAGSCGSLPHGGFFTGLHVSRAGLVDQVIQNLTATLGKHVFLRAARGTGKTLLLAELGLALQARGHTVAVAESTDHLEWWFASYGYLPHPDFPEFLLVDDVHRGLNTSSVRHFTGKDIAAGNLKTRTIFAGLPGDPGNSYILQDRVSAQTLTLNETELTQQGVVAYFAQQLSAAEAMTELAPVAVLKDSSGPAPATLPSAITKKDTDAAAKRLLSFAHLYTGGHAYACLRIASYLAAHMSVTQLLRADHKVTLTEALNAPDFAPVYEDVRCRCYSHLWDKAQAIVKGIADRESNGCYSSYLIDGFVFSPLLKRVVTGYAAEKQRLYEGK